jgi:hypothetical protein
MDASRGLWGRSPAWKRRDEGFFTVLAEVGYSGAMNIGNEDETYNPNYRGDDFTEQFKRGFDAAHEFLKTLIPPVAA